jgi:hypothetical protein
VLQAWLHRAPHRPKSLQDPHLQVHWQAEEVPPLLPQAWVCRCRGAQGSVPKPAGRELFTQFLYAMYEYDAERPPGEKGGDRKSTPRTPACQQLILQSRINNAKTLVARFAPAVGVIYRDGRKAQTVFVSRNTFALFPNSCCPTLLFYFFFACKRNGFRSQGGVCFQDRRRRVH